MRAQDRGELPRPACEAPVLRAGGTGGKLAAPAPHRPDVLLPPAATTNFSGKAGFLPTGLLFLNALGHAVFHIIHTIIIPYY